MSHIAIISEGLSKKYTIGDIIDPTLRGTLKSLFYPAGKTKDFWALQNINFKIERGQAYGVIGKNGAGKSTLLKILSKITYPTKGRAILNGRVASLLEVGTGFHPELTGRENVYLNGSLLGMSRAEINNRFDEIVDFSGVSKFIDTPIKRYSSGMYVRLAFSVAAHLRTEILLIDEVLAVGDVNFQEQCLTKMESIVDDGKTVLLVSHNMGYINRLCPKSMLLSKGQISYIGESKHAIEKSTSEKSNSFENEFIQIRDFKIESLNPNDHSTLVMKFSLSKSTEIELLDIDLGINNKGVRLFHLSSQLKDLSNSIDVQYQIQSCSLASDWYTCDININSGKNNLVQQKDCFKVYFNSHNLSPVVKNPGILSPKYHFSYE